MRGRSLVRIFQIFRRFFRVPLERLFLRNLYLRVRTNSFLQLSPCLNRQFYFHTPSNLVSSHFHSVIEEILKYIETFGVYCVVVVTVILILGRLNKIYTPIIRHLL